ncbi:hypothetical protein VULLAG_LOCUS8969 [Vulpes lagopus]
MELPRSESVVCKMFICKLRLYLKKLLLQLASSRPAVNIFANFFLAVHFGSCSPCDACWEPRSEPASGNGCGRTYYAAGSRTRQGTVGRGRVGGGRERVREPGGAAASVATGASGPGSGAGCGGGARGSVSGAGPGRSPNLANSCSSRRPRPWPRGGPGGGAYARLGDDGGDGERGREDSC